jgi:hypothetical protein
MQLFQEYQEAAPEAAVPYDITGWAFHAELRFAPEDAAPLVTFTAEVTDGPAGSLALSLSAEASAAIPAEGLAYFDLIADPGTGPEPWLTVRVWIRRPYTRPAL